jgi:AraC-like DNA-binding protein
MEITILPEDLKISPSNGVQVFTYKNERDNERSKINLSKNTISFLRAGTKEVIGDDDTVLIDNQKFVVMKSGNCLMTEKVSDSDRLYKSILLFFSNELVVDFLERNKLVSELNEEPKSYYIFDYDEFTHSFVESLEEILLMPSLIQEKILKAKFEEIMLYLTHHYGASFLNRMIHRIDDSMIRLTNIVENNRHNKLSLQELAFLNNMSISTFKREFYKHYHETPIRWFNNERLNRTALLIRAKRKRPIEVYEDAGYESFSNFIQAFKKRFGVTPKQYQIQN